MRLTLKDRRDWASRYLLYGLFVLLPFTAVFGHRGVAPWLLLASFPAFMRGDFWQTAYGELFEKWDIKNPFFAGFAAILFFCFWILLSGIWSPKHHYALFLNVLAPVLVGGSVIWFALNLSPDWRYRLATAFAAAIAGGMAVLAFEGFTDGFLRGVLPPADSPPGGARDLTALGRGVTALAPSLFPAAIIVSALRDRLAACALLALGVAAAFLNDVSANAAAIGFGFAVSVIAFKAPAQTLVALGWGVIILLLGAPLLFAFLPVDLIYAVAVDALPPPALEAIASWLHRLAVWQSVAQRIPEGLPFGFGADYARIWKETAPMITVPGAIVPVSVMPTHPHNVFLQVWLELGLPGVLSLAAALFFGMRLLQAANLSTPILAALAGAIATILVSVMVEGSIWQVWRLAAMALAGMGIALSYAIHQRNSGPRYG